MDEYSLPCGVMRASSQTEAFRERRKHPRTDCALLAAGERVMPCIGREAIRPTVVDRMLTALGLNTGAAAPPQNHGADRIAARREHLPAIAARLEVILGELDALEAWREATDLCWVIERIKARTAARSAGD